MKEHYKD
jgi:hypothetical protein